MTAEPDLEETEEVNSREEQGLVCVLDDQDGGREPLRGGQTPSGWKNGDGSPAGSSTSPHGTGAVCLSSLLWDIG